jgi:hypothetical protein
MYKSISIILGQLVLYWHTKDRVKLSKKIKLCLIIVKDMLI